MPSEAYKSYVALIKQMEDHRSSGELTSHMETEFERRMNRLWLGLSAKEAEALSDRIAETLAPPEIDANDWYWGDD